MQKKIVVGVAFLCAFISGCGQCRNLTATACTELGRDLLGRDGHERDVARALRVLKEACEIKKSFAGCTTLGASFIDDGFGVGIASDYTKAVHYLTLAAEAPLGVDENAGFENQGIGVAAHILAQMYQKMKGVPENEPRVRSLLARACTLGAPGACERKIQIGIIYNQPVGLGSDEKGNLKSDLPPRDELVRMANELRARCDRSDGESCHRLAWMMNRGAGVEWNARSAADLYEKACNLGYMPACNNLGVMFLYGAGRAEDKQQATSNFEKAAKGGLNYAQFNLLASR